LGYVSPTQTPGGILNRCFVEPLEPRKHLCAVTHAPATQLVRPARGEYIYPLYPTEAERLQWSKAARNQPGAAATVQPKTAARAGLSPLLQFNPRFEASIRAEQLGPSIYDNEAPLAWTNKALMPQRREEGASAVIGGKLYAFGGFYDGTFNATGRSDAYNPATNSWQQRATIPDAITHAPALTINGEAWLFGGYVGQDPGPSSKRVWIYNPTSNTWRRGPDMPAERGAGAVAQVGRFVYYVGGRNLARTEDVAAVYALDLDTNTWRTRAAMPNPRNHISAASLNGFLYAIGGQHREASQAQNLNDVHRYDPRTDRWTAVARLPIAMSHSFASTFAHEGRIYVVGGEVAHNVATGVAYAYDPSRDTWKKLGDLPQARRAAQAGVINGKLYVAGGSIVGAQKNDVWEAPLFNPAA
jgi:N-acetylneuraminic acid mutarotase